MQGRRRLPVLWISLGGAALVLGLIGVAGGVRPHDEHGDPVDLSAGWVEADEDLVPEVPPPPFQGDDEIPADEIYPCSECHEPDDYDPERRELKMAHAGIVLRHDEEHRWCLDCHDAENRDRLRLASGVLVPFEESYRLCGQCHGDKYRDWRAGIHGRRIGMWDGKKQYLLCVYCHDSHQPRYPVLEPLPPPVAPEQIR